MPWINRICAYLLPLLFFISCRSTNAALMEQKFDAPLRQKVTGLEREQRREILSVFGKCTSMIDESMRREISVVVNEVQSVTEDIFTVRISSEKIFDLAKLEFVMQLQLSHESKPLNQ